MTAPNPADPDRFRSRIHQEMLDSVDEELELELDDRRLGGLSAKIQHPPEAEAIDRHLYFRELLRLQGEMVKLQDWVVYKKLKVVVIFEGRDAAGKGGTIKALMERVSPRVFRLAALPAPSDRETAGCFRRDKRRRRDHRRRPGRATVRPGSCRGRRAAEEAALFRG